MLTTFLFNLLADGKRRVVLKLFCSGIDIYGIKRLYDPIETTIGEFHCTINLVGEYR